MPSAPPERSTKKRRTTSARPGALGEKKGGTSPPLRTRSQTRRMERRVVRAAGRSNGRVFTMPATPETPLCKHSQPLLVEDGTGDHPFYRDGCTPPPMYPPAGRFESDEDDDVYLPPSGILLDNK